MNDYRTVEAYRFDSKDECSDYLESLFKKAEFRNMDTVRERAAKYAKHDKELHDFFIEEAEKMLSSEG